MNHSLIDILWLLLAAVLVLIMQGGFLCLESGATRSKNAINVAMKNAADFVISVVFFWIIGFALMFGDSHMGILGITQFFTEIGLKDPWVAAFFVFQVMFCATAATIVSGAIAERVKFSSYLLITIFVVTIIYPISGTGPGEAHSTGIVAGWQRPALSILPVRP
jgi:Amt family ammonium transporter